MAREIVSGNGIERDVDAWDSIFAIMARLEAAGLAARPVTPEQYEQLSLLDRLHGFVQDRNYAAQRATLTVWPKEEYL